MRRSPAALALAAVLSASRVAAQRPPDHGTIVIVVGQEATLPIPSLTGGSKANQDVADLLYARLGRPGPGLVTSGERGFEPELARAWERRDSLTLVLELDPRARWHDGTPVTARDVVFAFVRARDRAVDPQHAVLLRYVETVTAEGDRAVVIRFTRKYGEQLYDALWHVPPLPAHLLETIPSDRIASSPFGQHPVGSGPYRWAAREPGRSLELAANPEFFLGAPKLDRVVFLLARDPEAQVNLILDGTGDALESVIPVSSVERVRTREAYRVVAVPTFGVGYLLFNQRAYGDRSRAHPILSSRSVRRALAMALDRLAMVKVAFGEYATVPDGPVAQLHWIRDPATRAAPYDPQAAVRLLEGEGWRDHDGDGVRDRNGLPLSLRLNFPGTSAPRALIAQLVQEQLRRIGVRADLVRLDGPVWAERRGQGEFDIDFSSAVLDPSPSGLIQSWSCAGRGGSNVAHYCHPAVDSLLDLAIEGRGDAGAAWREAIRAIIEDVPAVFVYAPASATVLHRRYDQVNIRPESWWSALREWRVKPGQQIARDLLSR
jgi:peptide/nickel transport system substrate-binding protein